MPPLSRTIDWPENPREARSQQMRLAPQVRTQDDFVTPLRLIAGADLAIDQRRREGIAAIMLYDFPSLELIEHAVARLPLTFPYVPGLLTYREGPVLCAAFAKLSRAPDILICDGQGISHPRGIGLASHLGLILDCPTIGCAKSRLVGSHDELPEGAGSQTPLHHESRVIGMLLRTRANTRPLYISSGHRVSLPSAVTIVQQCLTRFRLPLPTHAADRMVARVKRECLCHPEEQSDEGSQLV